MRRRAEPRVGLAREDRLVVEDEPVEEPPGGERRDLPLELAERPVHGLPQHVEPIAGRDRTDRPAAPPQHFAKLVEHLREVRVLERSRTWQAFIREREVLREAHVESLLLQVEWRVLLNPRVDGRVGRRCVAARGRRCSDSREERAHEGALAAVVATRERVRE